MPQRVPDIIQSSCESVRKSRLLRWWTSAPNPALGSQQHRREHTLLQLQLLPQTTHHLHRRRPRFKHGHTEVKAILCVYRWAGETGPRTHQRQKWSEGWTWPQWADLPAWPQAKWPKCLREPKTGVRFLARRLSLIIMAACVSICVCVCVCYLFQQRGTQVETREGVQDGDRQLSVLLEQSAAETSRMTQLPPHQSPVSPRCTHLSSLATSLCWESSSISGRLVIMSRWTSTGATDTSSISFLASSCKWQDTGGRRWLQVRTGRKSKNKKLFSHCRGDAWWLPCCPRRGRAISAGWWWCAAGWALRRWCWAERWRSGDGKFTTDRTLKKQSPEIQTCPT